MTGDEPPVPAWEAMEAAAVTRWTEVLDTVTDMLPGPAAAIVVDGPPAGAEAFADRLAAALRATGRACARLSDAGPLADGDDRRAGRGPATTTVADGPRWRSQPPTVRWDVVIWLRSPGAVNGNGEHGADIVLDLHDPAWPLIRLVSPALTARRSWYVAESRAFFGRRASTWDTRFGDDLPAYAAAVAGAGLRSGDTVLDVGCGTGRALPALRAVVGPHATAVGLDLTPQMLAVAPDRFLALATRTP